MGFNVLFLLPHLTTLFSPEDLKSPMEKSLLTFPGELWMECLVLDFRKAFSSQPASPVCKHAPGGAPPPLPLWDIEQGARHRTHSASDPNC